MRSVLFRRIALTVGLGVGIFVSSLRADDSDRIPDESASRGQDEIHDVPLKALHGAEQEQIWGLEKLAHFGPSAQTVRPQVIALLTSPSDNVRKEAVLTLAAMTGDAPPFVWRYELESKDAQRLDTAIEVLGDLQIHIRPQDAAFIRSKAEQALGDARPAQRKAAARVLMRFWPATAGVLVEAMKHDDWDVRPAVVDRLLEDPSLLPADGSSPDWPAAKAWVYDPVVVDLRKQVAKSLLYREMTAHGGDRAAAAAAIQRGDKPVSEQLLKLLGEQIQSSDADTAVETVKMARLLGKDAIPVFLEGTKSPYDVVQRDCYDILSTSVDANSPQPAIDAMIQLFGQRVGYSFQVRLCKSAVRWLQLQKTPPKGLVDALIDGLTPGNDRYYEGVGIRIVAAEALGRFHVEPKRSVFVLSVVLVMDDSDRDLVLAALSALREFGDSAKVALPEVKRVLSRDDWTLQSEAASTLAQLGQEGREIAGRFYVTRLVNYAGNHDVELQSLNDLARLGTDATIAMPRLRQFVDGNDADLRIASARTLSVIGPAANEVLPSLQRMLDNPSVEVRAAAAEAIIKISRDPVTLRAALLSAVYNADKSCAGRLAAALRQLPSDDAKQNEANSLLLKKLAAIADDDPEAAVQHVAKYAAASLGG